MPYIFFCLKMSFQIYTFKNYLNIDWKTKSDIFTDKYADKQLIKQKKWLVITGHQLLFTALT